MISSCDSTQVSKIPISAPSRPRRNGHLGRGSPFPTGLLRTIDDVEYATMEWVDWYNNRRLHSQLDYVPPEEYEAAYYAHIQAGRPATPQP
jgi:putative transposase